MSDRVQIPFSFSYPTSAFASSASGSFTAEAVTITQPVVGAAVTITSRTTLNPATVYQAETGASTYTSITTDSGGNVPGWVDPGSYKIAVAPSGSFTGATINFDAVRGDGVTNIASGVVDLAQLSSGVNTTLGYVRPGLPIGTTMHYLGSTDPVDADGQTRWLVMDGRAASRTTYSTLFSLIGTTYGAGNGSTTFNIPDARGRAVIGAGQGSGLTNRVLGSTGGVETYALQATEMPVHNHSASDSGHNHAATTNGSPFSGQLGQPGAESNRLVQPSSGFVSVQTGYANISIGNAGGGNAHQNMQPWMAANHIVKVLL